MVDTIIGLKPRPSPHGPSPSYCLICPRLCMMLSVSPSTTPSEVTPWSFRPRRNVAAAWMRQRTCRSSGRKSRPSTVQLSPTKPAQINTKNMQSCRLFSRATKGFLLTVNREKKARESRLQSKKAKSAKKAARRGSDDWAISDIDSMNSWTEGNSGNAAIYTTQTQLTAESQRPLNLSWTQDSAFSDFHGIVRWPPLPAWQGLRQDRSAGGKWSFFEDCHTARQKNNCDGLCSSVLAPPSAFRWLLLTIGPTPVLESRNHDGTKDSVSTYHHSNWWSCIKLRQIL